MAKYLTAEEAQQMIAERAAGDTIVMIAERHDRGYRVVKLVMSGSTFADLDRSALVRPVDKSKASAKLTLEEAQDIVTALASDDSIEELAWAFDVSWSIVYNIKIGRTWKELERPEWPKRVPAAEKPARGPRGAKRGSAHPNAALTERDVRAIVARLESGEGRSKRALAAIGREYDVTGGAIDAIRRGCSWGHITGIRKDNWKEYW